MKSEFFRHIIARSFYCQSFSTHSALNLYVRFADVNGTLYLTDEGLRETIIEMNDPAEDGW